MTDDNGLYYMRSRYYNPDIKRFINQDVLIGSIGNSDSLNRYSYVEGNPVSYTDPFGLSPYGYFGTFLAVMKFMSQLDIMSIVHVTLNVLGALPGCTWLNFINAGLYLAEQNYSEMCKSLLFGVANLDWVTYAAKFAVKIGKYTEKLEKILKCIDLGLHLKACYESAVDFGTIAAGMIDKYLVNGEDITWQTALEFLLLAGTGLQLGLLTHSLTGKLNDAFGGSASDGGGVSAVTKNKHVQEMVDDASSQDKKLQLPESNGTTQNKDIVYRAINQKDRDRLEEGLGLEAKNPNGEWNLKEHLVSGSSKQLWDNDPYISTTSDINVVKGFNEAGNGLGIVAIDLSKVNSNTYKGYEVYPRVNGIDGLPYHYSIWQQEVSVYQSIPLEAIVDFLD